MVEEAVLRSCRWPCVSFALLLNRMEDSLPSKLSAASPVREVKARGVNFSMAV